MSNNPKRPRLDRGAILLAAIAGLVVISAISSGLYKISASSALNEVEFNKANQARYLASSGVLYVQGEKYKFEQDNKTLDELIADLNPSRPSGSDAYSLGNTGTFSIAINSISANNFQATITGDTGDDDLQARFTRTETFQYNPKDSDQGTFRFEWPDSTPSSKTMFDVWNRVEGEFVNGARVVRDWYLGNVLRIDGGCDSFSLTQGEILNWTPSGTISVWIRLDRYRDWSGIMHKGDSSHSNPPYGIFDDEVWTFQFTENNATFDGIRIRNGNRKPFFALIKSNTEWAWLTSSSDLSLYTWYNIAITYSPDGIKMYINNRLDSSTSDYVIPRQNSSTITIGSQTTSDNCYSIDGYIGPNPQLWPKALPHTDSNVNKPSIERIYCEQAKKLGWDRSTCNKYTY